MNKLLLVTAIAAMPLAVPVQALESVAQLPVFKGGGSGGGSLETRVNQIVDCNNQRKFFNSTTGTCIAAQTKAQTASVPGLLFRVLSDTYNRTQSANLSSLVPADVPSWMLTVTLYNVNNKALNADFSFDMTRGTARTWQYSFNAGDDDFSEMTATYDGASTVSINVRSRNYNWGQGVKAASIRYYSVE